MANAPITFMTGPCTVYLAPYGSGGELPDIDGDTDGLSWTGGFKLGSAGKEDIGTGGVTLRKLTTFNEIRTDGTTGPVKALIDTETFEIEFAIHDMGNTGKVNEFLAGANKYGTTTTTAAGSSSGGYKRVWLGDEAGEAKLWSILVAIPSSPELAAGNTHLFLRKVYMSNDPAPVFQRGDVAAMAFTFRALQDTAQTANQQFGLWASQSAEPTG
tara:strand:+ start:242 stop:883 length:642 start_codon:yes stop_codon:yes gene_type:complete